MSFIMFSVKDTGMDESTVTETPKKKVIETTAADNVLAGTIGKFVTHRIF